MVRLLALTLGVVLGAAACTQQRESATLTTSAGPRASVETPQPPTTGAGQATGTSTGATSTAATAPPATPAGEVAIRATVAATFASARVIMLAEPVSGVTEVAFTAETRYRRTGGQPAALADLSPGTRIEVRGQPGAAGSLLAREVVLL